MISNTNNRISQFTTDPSTSKSSERLTNVDDSSNLEGCRVLVTGGSGLMGRRIVELLSKRGVKETIVYDLQDGSIHDEWYPQQEVTDDRSSTRITFVRGDVRDAQALVAACQGVDVVFHLAAIIDISPVTDPVIYDVNVAGTKNVIDACIANNVKVLVVTSSIEAAGRGPRVTENEPYPPPRDESSPPREKISTAYAESKRQTERLVLAAHGVKTSNGGALATICIRPGLMVDTAPGNMALGNALLRASKLGGMLHLYQTPVSLSWVHAKNAALVHICAAERAINQNNVGGRVFHAVDFDANLTDMYQEIFSDIPDINIVMLPLWLAMASTWFLDRCFRILNALTMTVFHYRLKPNVWCPDYNAASVTFHDFCFTNTNAQKHLGYGSLQQNGGVRLKTCAETIADAKAFSNKFYSKLKQGGVMYPTVSCVVSIVAFVKLWLYRVFGSGEHSSVGATLRLVGGVLTGRFRNFKPKRFLEKHESLLETAKCKNDFTLGVQHYYETMVDFIWLSAGPSWHFVPRWHGKTMQQSQELFQYELVRHLLPWGGGGGSRKVLEIGCGFGEIGIKVSSLSGATVTGLTMATNEVETASKHAVKGGRWNIVQGDYHNLPFKPCTFDAVLGVYTLKYSSKLRQALAEASRVLKPGGRFVSYEILVTDLHNPKDPHHVRIAATISDSTSMPPLHTAQEFRDAASEAGLEVVAEIDLGTSSSTDPWYECFVQLGVDYVLRRSWMSTLLRCGENLGVLPKETNVWYQNHVVHPTTDFVDGGKLGIITGSLLMVWSKK